MARPGFVLEVDERTPPLVVPSGDGFRLERFPLGTQVIYPADSSGSSQRALPDLEDATRAALDAPLDSDPLRERLRPGRSLTIVFDDITTPIPQMRRPDVRATVLEAVLTLAAEAGVDDVELIAATGLHRRMTPTELQRLLGERVFRSFFADGLLRNHDAEDESRLTSLGSGTGVAAGVNARVAGSDLVIFVHVVTDPRQTTGRELALGIGSTASITAGRTGSPVGGEPMIDQAISDVINDAVPVFQIDVVLDNDVFPAGLSFLSKREWELSLREQLAWRGIRRGLELAPPRARRRMINRTRADFSATGVFAGDPAAVSRASRTLITEQLRVPVAAQVDVGVLGVGQQTPYSVDAPVNPILAAWQGLVGLFGAHTRRPFVRPGGAVIIYHPLPNDFSPLHHPSYVDFYADVLSHPRDLDQLRADVEPKFAGDPWYVHLYRTSHAFHGVHPLQLWYEVAAAAGQCGDVVWVGADRAVADRLGFRAASTLADALEIVSSSVGRDPKIGYLHAPPQILVDIA